MASCSETLKNQRRGARHMLKLARNWKSTHPNDYENFVKLLLTCIACKGPKKNEKIACRAIIKRMR
jgi:hypothetical protein